MRQCCIHLRLPLILDSQLKERIIPAFEEALGPGYQALIIVNNSQGHSTYGKDALVATYTNINPGGNQPWMHDTWFIQDGEKITQTMVYPPSHPSIPTCQRKSRQFSLSMASIKVICMGNVPENVCQKIAATNRSLNISLTFKAKNHLYRRLLKLWATSVSSSQNSTVN